MPGNGLGVVLPATLADIIQESSGPEQKALLHEVPPCRLQLSGVRANKRGARCRSANL